MPGLRAAGPCNDEPHGRTIARTTLDNGSLSRLMTKLNKGDTEGPLSNNFFQQWPHIEIEKGRNFSKNLLEHQQIHESKWVKRTN